MAEKDFAVVLVEPHKEPTVTEIDGSLKGMQEVVGGYIEPIYLEDNACIICNEEGKINGLDLNRALYDQDHEIYDIVAGKFFICYAPPEAENFLPLPKELQEKYVEQFKTPEIFFKGSHGEILVLPEKPVRKEPLSAQIDNAKKDVQNNTPGTSENKKFER